MIMRIPILYVFGKNSSPTHIVDFDIWLFYCKNPIFWRVVESSHCREGKSATMLNRLTLVKDIVRILSKTEPSDPG